MGGCGSGRRWHWGARDTTEQYHAIDVRYCQRNGLLAPHRTFTLQWLRQGEIMASILIHTYPDRVILNFLHRSGDRNWQEENYPVYLSWTPCNLGGRRPWFHCPARSCGRRVAILYGGAIFACRHCHQLSYPSQREDPPDRTARRADAIRERLGWRPGILNGKGGKPQGMHWHTFQRLNTQHDAYVERSLAGLTTWLNRLEDPENP